MPYSKLKGALAASIGLALSVAFNAQAQSVAGGDDLSARINLSSLTSSASYSSFIVRYRDGAPTTSVAAEQNASAAMTRAVGLQASLSTSRPQVSYKRQLATGAHLVTTSRKLSQAEAVAFMQSIAGDPTVAYVEPDVMMRAIPYAYLLRVGVLISDQSLVKEATFQGLRTDPGSMPLYNAIALANTPRWGGSIEGQEKLLKVIDKQAAEHPLVLTVRATILADQADVRSCRCSTALERAAYRKVFSEVALPSDLYRAGSNALRNGQYELAMIYLTEALRFNPSAIEISNARNEAFDHVDPSVRGSTRIQQEKIEQSQQAGEGG